MRNIFGLNNFVFINLILLCGDIEENPGPSQLKIFLYVTEMYSFP